MSKKETKKSKFDPEVTDETTTEVIENEPEPQVEIIDELSELKIQLEQQNDLLLRTAAEFDNYKRRTERERLSMGEFIKANIVKSLLPTLDNINRSQGIEACSPEYAKGIEMIIKQLLEAVTSLGLTEIEAKDTEFNPTFHEAVMHIEDENYGENMVVEVLQKGYKVGDTVIRPAMVKVAN